MKKVFIRTFGCQMNEYDSEKMLSVLAEEHGGIEQVTQPDNADIILFNTCSVREKAQEKVFSDLGRVRPLKEKNPDLIIGVAGCVASQEGENIVKRAPYVDVVFGPQTLRAINSSKPEVLFPALRAARLRYVQAIVARNPTQKKWLNGWEKRIKSINFVG